MGFQRGIRICITCLDDLDEKIQFAPSLPSIINFEILKTELLLNFYVRHNTNKINKQINMEYMFSVPFVSLHSITM